MGDVVDMFATTEAEPEDEVIATMRRIIKMQVDTQKTLDMLLGKRRAEDERNT